MNTLHRALTSLLGVILLGTALAACNNSSSTITPAGYAPGTVSLHSVIQIPNIGPQPGFDFDIGIVDPTTDTYYFSDRTNKSVDIVDAKSNALLAQVGGFVGQLSSNSISGPNGMAVLPGNKMYATDGNSTVKVINLATRTVSKIFATGGVNRTDVVVYDPDDNVVLIANKN
jgi:DNA-binding beta-propeller fold protein YncE